MKVKFVPQNVEFTIEPGQCVMHVAQDHDLYIKSVCKGVPSCAECRVRVVDGEMNVLPPGSEELALIGTGHFIDRRRLSCQLKCFGDITVDMTEQIAKQNGLIGGQKKKKLAIKDDRIEDAQTIRAPGSEGEERTERRPPRGGDRGPRGGERGPRPAVGEVQGAGAPPTTGEERAPTGGKPRGESRGPRAEQGARGGEARGPRGDQGARGGDRREPRKERGPGDRGGANPQAQGQNQNANRPPRAEGEARAEGADASTPEGGGGKRRRRRRGGGGGGNGGGGGRGRDSGAPKTPPA